MSKHRSGIRSSGLVSNARVRTTRHGGWTGAGRGLCAAISFVLVILPWAAGADAGAEEGKKPRPGGPYGWQVMTEEEIAAYRDTLQGLSTPESRATFRVEHRDAMNARAREQGVDISGSAAGRQGPRGAKTRGPRKDRQTGNPRQGGPRRPVGWELMTEQERVAYKDTLQSLETREERTAFRDEQREKMEERAKAEGVTLQVPERMGTESDSGTVPESRPAGPAAVSGSSGSTARS